MTNQVISRDANRTTVLAGVKNDSSADIVMLPIDPTTGRLMVTATGTGSGDVSGPGASTDNAVVRWDGAAGTTVQNSTVIIGDTGNVTGLGTLNTHTLQAGTSTIALWTDKLSVFAATTSAELAGVISDETGSGKLTFATSPTLITPVLGVATATSINKVAITAPASSATLTIADGKTLTVSNTLTFTGTDTSSVAFGAGGTVAYTANKLSVFAATTSAELAGVISDETGTGVLVFNSSPTIVTPTIVSFANATHNHQASAGGGTLAEAALALTDITTNDVSISKHGFAPKAPNDATKFLDGTGAYSTPAGGVTGPTRGFIASTSFEHIGRFDMAEGGGVPASTPITSAGLVLDTTATISSYLSIKWLLGGDNANAKLAAGNGIFSCQLRQSTIATTGSSYFGLGSATPGGAGHTYTDTHIGFKIIYAAGVATLSATQSAGVTESATSLTTLSANDVVDCIAVITSGTSTAYYYRLNGTLSTVTTISTNMPAASAAIHYMQFSISNNASTSQQVVDVASASYTR